MKTNDAIMLEIEGMELSSGGSGGSGSTTPPESAEWMLLLAWLFGPLAFSNPAQRRSPDRAESTPRNAQRCAGPLEFLKAEETNDDAHQ
jgi:hypothetical protein